MIERLIQWHSIGERVPSNSENDFLMEFAYNVYGDFCHARCFGRFDTVMGRFYDADWKDLPFQPLYWAFVPHAA